MITGYDPLNIIIENNVTNLDLIETTDENITPVVHVAQAFSNPQEAKIWVLEKSIVFLKAQHREMLSSLQGEIEKLKQRNSDLQLKLECKLKTNPEFQNQNDVENFQSLIEFLNKELEDVQNANKILKQELETRKLKTTYLRHNRAKAHIPIIREAEQVKTQYEISPQHNHRDNTILSNEQKRIYLDKPELGDSSIQGISNGTIGSKKFLSSDSVYKATPPSAQSSKLSVSTLPPLLRPQMESPFDVMSCGSTKSYVSSTNTFHQDNNTPSKLRSTPVLPFLSRIVHPESVRRVSLKCFKQKKSAVNFQGLSSSQSSAIRYPIQDECLSEQGYFTYPVTGKLLHSERASPLLSKDQLISNKSANGRLEVTKPIASTGAQSAESKSMLPALNQSLDSNQTKRQKKNQEQQQRRLERSKNPYIF